MAKLAAERKQAILDKLISRVREHHSPKVSELLSEFIAQYYINVSYEDLEARSLEDLYGALMSHWAMIDQNQAGEVQVRVFNPSLEKDGFQSQHTAIQIVQDDMPFMVDSLRMEIQRRGLSVHYIVHLGGLKVHRDKHKIDKIYPRDQAGLPEAYVCAPIYIEIDRQTDAEVLAGLEACLRSVLHDVAAVVNDRDRMFAALAEAIAHTQNTPPPLAAERVAESIAFLHWLEKNFIFFGVRDYRLRKEGDEYLLDMVEGSGLGLLREVLHEKVRRLSDLPPAARKLALSHEDLVISTTNTRSTIRRAGYMSYIGVKYFDQEGQLTGEKRFVGLYPLSMYLEHPSEIPFVRLKVAEVLRRSGFIPGSHAYRKLRDILETFPRDDLFQATTEELAEISMGIFYLQEREQVRLFMRKDAYGRYLSCLVYVPTESYNTDLAKRMEAALAKTLEAKEITLNTLVSSSALARLHFEVRVDPHHFPKYHPEELEKQLQDLGRSWRDDLRAALVAHFGEAYGVAAFNRYRYAFPLSYREVFTARFAVPDIEKIESLNERKLLAMDLYYPVDQDRTAGLRFKIYQKHHSVPLSDALPILENMGCRVLSERSYELCFDAQNSAWINDFEVAFRDQDPTQHFEAEDLFQSAFAAVWLGLAENDAFNGLVVRAKLTWREVALLRAYASYFQQLGFTFSQQYVSHTLAKHPKIARKLVDLFVLRFDPLKDRLPGAIEDLAKSIEADLDAVKNLDEDRILRQYVMVMQATLRTNFYQLNSETGKAYDYISFKLSPRAIPNMPLPKPLFEIFTYSPRFEGVHLRFSEVARGGLRWSDRREDYRTEVLGLMKAQQVKNAVIVPQGAKGGFYPKHMAAQMTRDEIQAEGIACYQLFIQALLKITDNIVDHVIVPPAQVVRYDQDDAYLVVAADKGTATFSDLANAISVQEGFWLGDAFASGGATGYDHKKMGITARGAWESVKRHFRELGHDTQTEDFTVLGIGDMAGDVFGNGMLLSPHIRLVAAFNHAHIFIDPAPDAAKSFVERQRVFNLPRSTWEDYDTKLISKGGGVFKRSEKLIVLTPEIKELLGLTQETMIPSEFIHHLLKMPVDLLWNGGIGTYVKASTETHADVRDKANDLLRVNGGDLRCRVVGEGGNMGFTQLGRVEFALNGGRIYTDFIDNSAGVDCSDHEVNLKILLNQVVEAEELTMKQRNELLADMTTEVGQLVLLDNYRQTQALGLASEKAVSNLDLYGRYMHELERQGLLDRRLEFLPNEKALMERKAAGLGLTRPELAVLFAYSKNILKTELLASDVPDDPYLFKMIFLEFPKVIRERYAQALQQHPLKRAIIATQVANVLINEMSITFIMRVRQETGASVADIVKAFVIAQEIFGKDQLWQAAESLDTQVETSLQFHLMRRMNRVVRRATRWFLRNHRSHLNIEAQIQSFKEPVQKVVSELPRFLGQVGREKYQGHIADYTSKGVPQDLAEQFALSSHLFSALDITEAGRVAKVDLLEMAEVYLYLEEVFDLTWVRHQIIEFASETLWDALARSGFRDDLDLLQRSLAISVISHRSRAKSVAQKLAKWMEHHVVAVDRWRARLEEMKAMSVIQPVMFSVILRDLMDVVQQDRQGEGF